MVNPVPRHAPWVEMDSSAYVEHEGSKRQGEMRPAITYRYSLMTRSRGRDGRVVFMKSRCGQTLQMVTKIIEGGRRRIGRRNDEVPAGREPRLVIEISQDFS